MKLIEYDKSVYDIDNFCYINHKEISLFTDLNLENSKLATLLLGKESIFIF